jgi:hypothetical protein
VWRVACSLCLSVIVWSLSSWYARASRPAEELLPPDTKGYVAVSDLEKFTQAWNQTQLGALLRDPQLRPFAEQVWQQLRDNVSETYRQLAVDWDVIQKLTAGQVAAAVLEPAGENSHAVVVILDVTPARETLHQVQTTIDGYWKQKRATVTQRTIASVPVTVYSIPVADSHRTHKQAFYAVAAGKWIATDDENVLRHILQRIEDPSVPALANNPAYRATQQETVLENGTVSPHVRWYIEPFGYARIVRATSRMERQRGTDILKILQAQGFDVIEAVGGQIALAVGDYQVLHRTLVYAPGERRLAARLLDFPNGPALNPPDWIPGNVANYVAFRWDMQGAFESVKTLVDALTSEGFFEEFLTNLEQDPRGPQVNLRRDLVQHLGRHVLVVTDCTQPIGPRSERFAVAIEVTDNQVVARTVEQMLRNDRTATRHDVRGLVVWEVSAEEPEEDVTLTLEVDTTPGFGFGTPRHEVVKEEVPTLPNTAIAVGRGYVWFSSHREYLEELLAGTDQSALGTQDDYRSVATALEKLGAGQECLRVFSRSDETYRATYELMRQGRLADSQSLLIQWFNQLNSGAAGQRQQAQDGSALPPYDYVRRYLGPAGAYSSQHSNGWTITGCLLKSSHP